MIRLISYDDVVVEFSKQAATLCPYITDAFAFPSDLDYDQTLYVLLGSGTQLLLLKQALEAAHFDEGNFLPTIGNIQIGERILPGLPLFSYTWCPTLQTFLKSLDEDQLTDLIYIADDMCMWSLRNGLLQFLLYRVVKYDWKFHEFFTSYRVKLATVAIHLYEEITSGVDNGYCAPRNSSRPD